MFPVFDVYRDEFEQFQWEVHILIEGTLSASIRYLDKEANAELAKIQSSLDKATDDDYQQYLVDEHVDVLATNDGQERFLRNMALVALASRLTHSLRKMARSAENFCPRKKRYGAKNMSEFERLFVEYAERFGINFQSEAARIAFIEPMREVRNQIVHDGSEANTLKPFDEIDMNQGDSGLLDMWFSQKYPEYVDGIGYGAEVSVSQELLDNNIKSAMH